MKKLVVLLLVSIILSTTAYANTYEVQYENYALKLKEIGVFKGTSTGFELDREPTRIEAAVMFVRLLGAEQEALDMKYEHTFTDVPEWASAYVGYLYHEGLSNGTSATTFGSIDFIQAKSYMTFILRALGYDDAAGDFSWSNALEFAKDQSLISEEDYDELISVAFLRDHVAKFSYKALSMMLKSDSISLIQKLIDMDAIDESMKVLVGLDENQLRFGSLSDDTIIDIPSKTLRMAIHNKIDYKYSSENNITFGELKNIKSLIIDGSLVFDSLEGIQYAINLEELYIWGFNGIEKKSPLTDINQLRYLNNLRVLEIKYTNIEDICALNNLKNLKVLELYKNNFSDISMFGTLKQLESLKLSGTNITDFSSLAGLINLKELNLSSNNISDISFISHLTNLNRLYLNNNNITNVNLLTNLSYLKDLSLESNPLTDESLDALLPMMKYCWINLDDQVRSDLIAKETIKSSATTTLTPEITNRLKSYPYIKRFNFSEDSYRIVQMEPGIGYDSGYGFEEGDISSHQWIYNNFMDNLILEENEKIFSDINLTYFNQGNFAIRYVLQTSLEDGTIEEYDKEFQFYYGGPIGEEPILRRVGFIYLSNKSVILNND